jgi:hypothetical protein
MYVNDSICLGSKYACNMSSIILSLFVTKAILNNYHHRHPFYMFEAPSVINIHTPTSSFAIIHSRLFLEHLGIAQSPDDPLY